MIAPGTFRLFLSAALAAFMMSATSCASTNPGHAAATSHPEGMPPAEALAMLRAGNERFVSGRLKHPHESQKWREHEAAGQHPSAIIVGCADSRVPPEVVFDQGLSDLFVARVAGNVAAQDVLGSVEYGVLHLHVQLIVVLGHEECGAITATVHGKSHSMEEPAELRALLSEIDPVVAGMSSGETETLVHRAVEANVRQNVKVLRDTLSASPAFKSSHFEVLGAVYDLKSGEVRWLEE